MRKSGLPAKAWVLVADGEKALFLVNDGDDIDMNLRVLRKEEQENPKAKEWATDKPGRMNDGPASQRSSMDDTDWHELEKERFADDLADRLYKAAHKGAFDKLVIVASRVVLSSLRDQMHQEVEQRVMLEVPKVLTGHSIDDIEKNLAAELDEA